jgi:hypothetical protein
MLGLFIILSVFRAIFMLIYFSKLRERSKQKQAAVANFDDTAIMSIDDWYICIYFITFYLLQIYYLNNFFFLCTFVNIFMNEMLLVILCVLLYYCCMHRLQMYPICYFLENCLLCFIHLHRSPHSRLLGKIVQLIALDLWLCPFSIQQINNWYFCRYLWLYNMHQSINAIVSIVSYCLHSLSLVRALFFTAVAVLFVDPQTCVRLLGSNLSLA